MTTEARERLAMDIVAELLELPAAQREPRLADICGGDELLCQRVMALLRGQHQTRGDSFTSNASEPPRAADLTPSWFTQPASGRIERIGQFKLLGRIGIGGMGEVYEAQQERPHRRVALKLIHPLRMNSAMLRRFEFEAEVLGRLDHPGIARVHEAGTAQTERGPQSYFAMELVRGQRLDHWVERMKPALVQRLRILIDLCDAVQHAHQHGVIHRDLKPANILVNDEGKPKILDFGVARAMEGDGVPLAETMHTETGQVVGTLQYMSPEQAAGDVRNMDTRCDVYALGVIAYQLLADRLPYDVSNKLLPEAVRIICENEPAKLSSINRSLRGDLETIVLKALAKDKALRYSSSAELGADVKRYLDYEPITARPPSTWYQLSKFARRNKVLVGAFAVAFMALAIGALAATWGWVNASRQKRQAESANAQAQAVVDFFTEDVVGAASPQVTRSNRELTVREALDKAATQVPQKFKDRPLVEAAIRHALAWTYDSLGRADLAEPHATKELEIRRRELGVDHPDTLKAMEAVVAFLTAQSKLTEAESVSRDLLERRERVLGAEHPDTLGSIANLATVLRAQGKFQEAETLHGDVLRLRRRLLGPDDPATLMSMNNLAIAFKVQGKLDQAEPLLREALAGHRRVLGNDHPDTLNSIGSMAGILKDRGELAQAEALYKEALETSRRVLGDDHPGTLVKISNQAHLLRNMGRLTEAESLNREALATRRRVLGENHPDALDSMCNLGELLVAEGKLAEAEPLLREALDGRRRQLGEDHPDTLNSMLNLAYLLKQRGRLAEAQPIYGDTVEGYRRVLGPDHPDTLQAISHLASLLQGLGRLADAEERYREALQGFRRVLGNDHALTLFGINNLGGVLELQGNHEEAEPLFAELYRQVPATEMDPSRSALLMARWGPCLVRVGRHQEADAPLRDAYSRLIAARLQGHKRMQAVIIALVEVCEHTNRPQEASKFRAELSAIQAATTTQS